MEPGCHNVQFPGQPWVPRRQHLRGLAASANADQGQPIARCEYARPLPLGVGRLGIVCRGATLNTQVVLVLTVFMDTRIPNAKHRQIIKKYFPTTIFFFTNYWTYSLIVRPIAPPTPVGLDVALPTEGGRARSLRSHVATIPYSALASPIPALPWRLRSFPQNGALPWRLIFRFVSIHKYHW